MKFALLNGAAQGVGGAVARGFAAAGASLAPLGVNDASRASIAVDAGDAGARLRTVFGPVAGATIRAQAASRAAEVAKRGARRNGLAPGSAAAPMLRDAVALADDKAVVWATIRSTQPLRRPAEPAQVGAPARFLWSDQASHVAGEAARVDGGLTSILGDSAKWDDS